MTFDDPGLVADAGLGTINSVRLSLAALATTGASGATGATGATGRADDVPPVPVVVLNRFDPASELHRRNLDWLRHTDGTDVTEATGWWLESVAGRLCCSRRRVAP